MIFGPLSVIRSVGSTITPACKANAVMREGIVAAWYGHHLVLDQLPQVYLLLSDEVIQKKAPLPSDEMGVPARHKAREHNLAPHSGCRVKKLVHQILRPDRRSLVISPFGIQPSYSVEYLVLVHILPLNLEKSSCWMSGMITRVFMLDGRTSTHWPLTHTWPSGWLAPLTTIRLA